MTFELHPNLSSKIFIADLLLCRLLLHDESQYPWLILVPRRANISRMMELSSGDQQQLMLEIDLAQNVLWKEFNPTQLNVAAIGNKTPQLHVHVIARFSTDPAWPGTVWDHPAKKPYSLEEKKNIQLLLRGAFSSQLKI